MSCDVMSCDVMSSDNCSLGKCKNVDVTVGPYVSCWIFFLLW